MHISLDWIVRSVLKFSHQKETKCLQWWRSGKTEVAFVRLRKEPKNYKWLLMQNLIDINAVEFTKSIHIKHNKFCDTRVSFPLPSLMLLPLRKKPREDTVLFNLLLIQHLLYARHSLNGWMNRKKSLLSWKLHNIEKQVNRRNCAL